MWMMVGALGLVACVWIAFGWFTIGNAKRRVSQYDLSVRTALPRETGRTVWICWDSSRVDRFIRCTRRCIFLCGTRMDRTPGESSKSENVIGRP